MNYEKLVETYVKVRDKKAELKAKFDAELRPYNEALEKIEQKLLAAFSESGMESVRTSAGTAYRAMKTSVSVADRDLFIDYVKENDAWELIETRAAKRAVEEFKAANDDLPPGLNWNAVYEVNVRRSS